MWPEEAAAVQESGRSLTELRSVGPFTAHFIAGWLREPPDPPVPPPLRDGFITYAYARTVVEVGARCGPPLRVRLPARDLASESVSFVQQKGAIRTKGARHGIPLYRRLP
jgi:hypothetical protein